VAVQLDLSSLIPGTYQLTPTISVAQDQVTVQSILPGTVEVIITRPGTVTPTP
jgi:hypothetical protein